MEELRAAVKPLLEKLNARPMRRLKKSRRALYEQLDKPALKPLPARPYEFAEWAKGKVGPHYHVEFREHFYSVHYTLVHQHAEVRATATTVELLVKGVRVASHVRDDTPNQYTTLTEHMPKAHRDHAEWDPPRLIAWARKVGPATAELVEGIMVRRKHPQHGFQACLGVMSLRKTYEDSRIEAACARALKVRAFSYKSVKAILKNGLDREAVPEERNTSLPLHGNIRGPGYYH
jgi:transposase